MMLCLEVTVNGEPYCVAGRRDAWVGAGISRDFDLGALKVSTLGFGRAEFYRWDADESFLKVGDVVTVRVVERAAADPPRSPSTAPPELFQSVSRYPDAEVWLWVGLIVGAAMILLFG
jgi:hypothetical protein